MTSSAREHRDGGPAVPNGPTDRWRHPRDVLLAQIQQVRVSVFGEIGDDDLAIRIPERDGRRRVDVAMHLGAGTHEGRLNHTDVIFKHRTGGRRPGPQNTITLVPIGTRG